MKTHMRYTEYLLGAVVLMLALTALSGPVLAQTQPSKGRILYHNGPVMQGTANAYFISKGYCVLSLP